MAGTVSDSRSLGNYRVRLVQRLSLAIGGWCLAAVSGLAPAEEATVRFSGERRQNNLAAELLDVTSISKPGSMFTFTRSSPGWVHLSAAYGGQGTVRIVLHKNAPDKSAVGDTIIDGEAGGGKQDEAMRHVAAGEHRLELVCSGTARVDRLVVKAIPELIHCGLGFDPAIKSYGKYDLAFLKKRHSAERDDADRSAQHRT